MADSNNLEQRLGLCSQCEHAKQVRSSKGPLYVLCRLAASDDRFAKYPYCPVVQCSGFVKEKRDD